MARVKGLFVDPILFDIAHMAVDIVAQTYVYSKIPLLRPSLGLPKSGNHLWYSLKVGTLFGTAKKRRLSLGLPKSGDHLWDCLKAATIFGIA